MTSCFCFAVLALTSADCGPLPCNPYSYADLNGMAVRQLYQRGLVWLEVPVRPEDQLSIPPLEVGGWTWVGGWVG